MFWDQSRWIPKCALQACEISAVPTCLIPFLIYRRCRLHRETLFPHIFRAWYAINRTNSADLSSAMRKFMQATFSVGSNDSTIAFPEQPIPCDQGDQSRFFAAHLRCESGVLASRWFLRNRGRVARRDSSHPASAVDVDTNVLDRPVGSWRSPESAEQF